MGLDVHEWQNQNAPFHMNDETPATEFLTPVQKQIREVCAKLADSAKLRANTQYRDLIKPEKLWFFATFSMRVRLDLDCELSLFDLDEEDIAALLILLRACRAPGARDIDTSIEMVCSDIAALLIEKNRAYGNSALDPIRKFSKASPVEQILVRLDDKLSRLARGRASGEDVEKDLIGYLVLLRIARNEAANG